ncbi:hypothetical protein D1871_21810 [Nakamurella silvestris]|nr:hypothetical protein D1871_21810 [Nakamurella silvestris]
MVTATTRRCPIHVSFDIDPLHVAETAMSCTNRRRSASGEFIVSVNTHEVNTSVHHRDMAAHPLQTRVTDRAPPPTSPEGEAAIGS